MQNPFTTGSILNTKESAKVILKVSFLKLFGIPSKRQILLKKLYIINNLNNKENNLQLKRQNKNFL